MLTSESPKPTANHNRPSRGQKVFAYASIKLVEAPEIRLCASAYDAQAL
jgi:hypothetical protein